MVFTKKIKVKNNEYWVLVHSIRKGKKIIQKKKYIGKILPPKLRLEQLKKEFLKELTIGRYKFISNKDIEEIEKKKFKNLGGSYGGAISMSFIKTDGTLWACGQGTEGQLGLGNTTAYSSPVQVGHHTDWLLTTNGGHSMGIRKAYK